MRSVSLLEADTNARHECRVCKQLKGVDAFSHCEWGRKLQGKTGRCRACASDYRKAKYEADKAALVSADISKLAATQQPCARCKVPLGEEAYSAGQWKRFAAAGVTGGVCRSCVRHHSMRTLHRVSAEEIRAMVAEQGGGCAICQEQLPESGLGIHVDHHHESGRNRGVLCGNCNTAIGLLKEEPRRFVAAIQYLVKHHPEKRDEAEECIKEYLT